MKKNIIMVFFISSLLLSLASCSYLVPLAEEAQEIEEALEHARG
jgi:hypothetical protein